MRFGQLRGVKNGDKTGVVAVSLHDYTPPQQAGYVPPGRFPILIADAEYRHAESGAGVNLVLSSRTSGPAGYENVPLARHYVYLPFDDALEGKSEEEIAANETLAKLQQLVEIAYGRLQHLLRSIASADPEKLKKLSEKTPDGKPQYGPIEPAKLINKTAFIETQLGDKDVLLKSGRTADFSNRAEIRWFISAEDYEAKPGPFQTPTSDAEQKTEPELGAKPSSGNGTKTGASDAASAKSGQAGVNDLVDF